MSLFKILSQQISTCSENAYWSNIYTPTYKSWKQVCTHYNDVIIQDLQLNILSDLWNMLTEFFISLFFLQPSDLTRQNNYLCPQWVCCILFVEGFYAVKFFFACYPHLHVTYLSTTQVSWCWLAVTAVWLTGDVIHMLHPQLHIKELGWTIFLYKGL